MRGELPLHPLPHSPQAAHQDAGGSGPSPQVLPELESGGWGLLLGSLVSATSTCTAVTAAAQSSSSKVQRQQGPQSLFQPAKPVGPALIQCCLWRVCWDRSSTTLQSNHPHHWSYAKAMQSNSPCIDNKQQSSSSTTLQKNHPHSEEVCSQSSQTFLQSKSPCMNNFVEQQFSSSRTLQNNHPSSEEVCCQSFADLLPVKFPSLFSTLILQYYAKFSMAE
eukprot:2663848-Rhodomonas_salina.2